MDELWPPTELDWLPINLQRMPLELPIGEVQLWHRYLAGPGLLHTAGNRRSVSNTAALAR